MINTTFDQAYNDVVLLVERFEDNKKHYMSSTYSEAEARQEFIDKFFIALGWDVTHQYQHNPYAQDVKIEKSQKQQNESARKRADYAFFNGPNFKDVHFFVEAKKPSVLLQNNAQHYFQTIKYGWNASCPISILTDFEEFVILDCRSKPNIKYALNGKHKSFRYTDYKNKEKFAEIYYLFSREAIANNSIENYVSNMPKASRGKTQKQQFKGGYQAIDESFLEYIDGIRETIAKAFKKANPNLDSETLTESTQKTIDRLVFTRFLEDKLIEPINYIKEWGTNKNPWQAFIKDCKSLNVKYNGVVFKPIFIDNVDFKGADEKLFGNICNELCSDNSPYDFNYIPIHILGSIYERFLGKIVVATAKQVRIEEKPEVRKAGGVYYTPKYIVDYIVANTVGKLIKGKSPTEIAEMTFADIACGSGSFLIGVYDYLLQYHNEYYLKNPSEAQKDGCENVDGIWKLSIHQKQDILLNNIYGVDIDSQAVEVTQLSLFLKMLEDETMTSTMAQAKQSSIYTKVLPDLTKNIVCGNSLIGTDILSPTLFKNNEHFTERQELKINSFDFQSTFPKIFKIGGFNAIVGNPPYVQQSMYSWFDVRIKRYLLDNYSSSMGRLNTFGFFIERAIELLKEKGQLGYIVPNTILSQEYYEGLRTYILNNSFIDEIVNYEKLQFVGAVVETVSLLLLKQVKVGEVIISKLNKDNTLSERSIDINIFKNSYKHQFIVQSDTDTLNFKNRIENKNKKLSSYLSINQGIALKSNRASFIFDDKIDDTFKPILDGREIDKYSTKWAGKYLKYDINNIHSCKREDIFNTNEKIIFRRVSSTLIATIDKSKFYTLNTLIVVNLLSNIELNIKYFLALFNSKFYNWYYVKFFKSTKKVFSEIQARQVAQLPVPNLNLENQIDKKNHDHLVSLVEQMLDSKLKLQTAILDKDISYFEQKCKRLEFEIDQIVYLLFDLSKEEIALVEGEK